MGPALRPCFQALTIGPFRNPAPLNSFSLLGYFCVVGFGGWSTCSYGISQVSPPNYPLTTSSLVYYRKALLIFPMWQGLITTRLCWAWPDLSRRNEAIPRLTAILDHTGLSIDYSVNHNSGDILAGLLFERRRSTTISLHRCSKVR